jgi:TPR repeat protein
MPKPKTTPGQERRVVSGRRSVVTRSLAGVLVVFLSSSTSSMAGDFENGVAAYNRLDSATAWRLLQPLAERGDAGAQAVVGSMYARGLGVTYDGAEAVRWWRKAAEQGSASAQEELATAYFWGDGVQPNHSEAAKWFRKAAEQGGIFAQTSLAYLYARGEGVPKDLALAHMWLNLAAAQGQPAAKIGLDRLASKMTTGQVAEAQRLARGWKPTK